MPRIGIDKNIAPENLAGRHDGVDESGNWPRAAKQKHIYIYINIALSGGANSKTEIH